MTNNFATIDDLFAQSIVLEKAMETLYRHFADLFSGYPEVMTFWKHYADEERGHTTFLERVRQGMDASRLAEPANADMLRNLRYCLNATSLERLGNIYTLEDAFQVATELENSETNAIFEFMIVNYSTDELARSHKFLRVQLKYHIAKLRDEFPLAYQSPAQRRNVPAKDKE